MFGYVKPVSDELLLREYTTYRALYCGICRAMQKHTGRLSALSLSYDSVFYALIRLMLTKDPCTACRCHCGMHPCKGRQCIKENDTLVFSARAFAVLAYGKVCDAYDDSGFFGRIPLFFARATLRRAAKRAAMPALLADMQKELAALAQLEKEKCSSVDQVADCSGRMLATFFAAGLEGEDKETAYTVGLHLGRFIAVVDAVDDYEKDKKKGNYNPYLYTESGLLSDKEKRAAYYALTGELCKMEEAILRLPHEENPTAGNIIKNILYLGLPERIAFLAPGKEQTDD